MHVTPALLSLCITKWMGECTHRVNVMQTCAVLLVPGCVWGPAQEPLALRSTQQEPVSDDEPFTVGMSTDSSVQNSSRHSVGFMWNIYKSPYFVGKNSCKDESRDSYWALVVFDQRSWHFNKPSDLVKTVGQKPKLPAHTYTQHKKGGGTALGWDAAHQASSWNLVAEAVVVLPCWVALDAVCSVH